MWQFIRICLSVHIIWEVLTLASLVHGRSCSICSAHTTDAPCRGSLDTCSGLRIKNASSCCDLLVWAAIDSITAYMVRVVGMVRAWWKWDMCAADACYMWSTELADTACMVRISGIILIWYWLWVIHTHDMAKVWYISCPNRAKASNLCRLNAICWSAANYRGATWILYAPIWRITNPRLARISCTAACSNSTRCLRIL